MALSSILNLDLLSIQSSARVQLVNTPRPNTQNFFQDYEYILYSFEQFICLFQIPLYLRTGDFYSDGLPTLVNEPCLSCNPGKGPSPGAAIWSVSRQTSVSDMINEHGEVCGKRNGKGHGSSLWKSSSVPFYARHYGHKLNWERTPVTATINHLNYGTRPWHVLFRIITK
jgi:hypothetical protein